MGTSPIVVNWIAEVFDLGCSAGQAQRSPTRRFPRFLVGLRKLFPPCIGEPIGPGLLAGEVSFDKNGCN